MRLGIVGTGHISDRICEAAQDIQGLDVTAIYSRKLDTGRAFAEKHGIPHVFCELCKMLTSGKIDAVYIASPTLLHCEQTLAACEAKVAVLCEKMLTAEADECDVLARAVASGGTVVEAMRPTFDSRIALVRDRLADIGAIRSVRLEYRQYSSRYDAYLQGDIKNAFDPSLKNSALADIGIYPLHLAVSLFGEPRDISAVGSYLDNGFLAEGEVTLIYDAFSVNILYSKITEGENISYIEGELGRIIFDRINEPSYARLELLTGKTVVSERLEGESNIRCELLEFMRIAESDRAECLRLFEISHAVMRTVGRIYDALGISFDRTD